MSKRFFYLPFYDTITENHIRIIRDSSPRMELQLNTENDKWMRSIFESFFNERGQNLIVRPDKKEEKSVLRYVGKDVGFNFDFKPRIKDKEKELQSRLKNMFEHAEIVLQPHQEHGLNKMWKSKGEIVFNDEIKDLHESWIWAWSTGSGKSYQSLSVFSRIPVERVFILCSNASLMQWASYVCAMAQPPQSNTIFEIIGLTEFASRLIDHEDRPGDDNFLKNQFVIFDEAHVFRHMTTVMQVQIEALRKSRFLQTLTATLTVNHLSDIIGLCKIHGGSLSEHEISELKHNNSISTNIVDDILTRCFQGRIDWYDAKEDLNAGQFYAPTTIVIKEVPMTWEQTVDYMVKKKNDFLIGDDEDAMLCITRSARNSYRKNQKQISNSSGDFSPKFDAVCDTIESFNQFPIIVYSHYLENGITTIYNRMKRRRPDLEIDIAIGTTKTQQREMKRIKYNNKKLDILCLSNIGNASLDFANSKALFLVDCFDNLAMEMQAIGRVSRFKAHKADKDGLISPIIIFKFISTFPNFTTMTNEKKAHITQYFYNTYCNPNVGSLETLIPFDFVDELITKIKVEENNQTVEQQLEISNVYGNIKLAPANKRFKTLGS